MTLLLPNILKQHHFMMRQKNILCSLSFAVAGLIYRNQTTLALLGTPAGDELVMVPAASSPRLVFITRPGTAPQQAVIATSIIRYMKAIKIWRINSAHPHLDLAAADEYGRVMDLQGCFDCCRWNKVELMLGMWLRKCRST